MTIIDKFLGLIAPPVCVACGQEGSHLCASCTPVNLQPFGARCYRCNRLSPGNRTCHKCARLGGPRHMWISVVYAGVAEQMVEDYKYKCGRQLAEVLAGIMAQSLIEHNLPADTLIVPVPTATTRIRERGFDHTALIAKHLARQLGLTHGQALSRFGQAQQVGAKRTQRIRQVESSYAIKRPELVARRPILLIDDVLTTGATIETCARVLRKAGAKRVDGIVFAKKQ